MLVAGIQGSKLPNFDAAHPLDIEKRPIDQSKQDAAAQQRTMIAPRPVSISVGASETRNLDLSAYNRPSFGSSSSTLMLEKGLAPEEVVLPEKRYGQLCRNIRWTVFSVYRRLNVTIVLINVLVMAVLGALQELFKLPQEKLAIPVAANVTAAVLMRQELVINLLFILFGMCPRWMPLRIRRLAAKIYHLGGVHSGAGVAATIWFALLNVVIFKSPRAEVLIGLQTALFVITIVLDVLLVSIVVLSHPGLRSRFHNAWEAVHRFAGWTTVILFWAHLAISTAIQKQTAGPYRPAAEIVMRNPVLWCLVVVTCSLILPWLRLRKVPVQAEALSEHAVRLHFEYTNLPFCASPRLSDNPLKEWHAFAGIPEENGVGFSVLVSKAGDWTSRLIQSPPQKLWIRGIPVRGVLHIAPIFNKIVVVATGSGIGPVLSLLYARQLQCRIVWSTPDPLRTYKRAIHDQVLIADPQALIINTTKTGRPDLIREAYRLYESSQAEAVFVISNPKVTRKVVYGLESRGIPTFAPIFDS